MKNCIYCGLKNENSLLKYCKSCYYSEVIVNKEVKSYRIKQKSSKNSNIPAKFSNEIKKLILNRDIKCILCWKDWTDIHHVFFSNQAEYWNERNNIDKWVLLCRLCHWKCHSCKTWEWERQEVINYLHEYYARKSN